jgi:hypothetical protein
MIGATLRQRLRFRVVAELRPGVVVDTPATIAAECCFA